MILMPDFELKVFQADAAKTIVDRYAFFAGHPYRPSKGQNRDHFFRHYLHLQEQARHQY
jgi:type III restriction enzyme